MAGNSGLGRHAAAHEDSLEHLPGPDGYAHNGRFSSVTCAPIDHQGGESVPTVIATHEVKDTDRWLASPKREEVFGPIGVTNIRTFVDPQNRKRVAVLMDISDMDAVMRFMETPAAMEAMEYDGVITETMVMHVEA
jgi:hypothetical protein